MAYAVNIEEIEIIFVFRDAKNLNNDMHHHIKER